MPARMFARHGSAPDASPRAAEVACEHAAVPELLRGELPRGGDDQRLEQPLADRLAVEEVAILAHDRQLRQEARRVGAGRDNDRLGVQLVERADLADPDLETACEGLDDALRTVEVAVGGAPGGPHDRVGSQAGYELRRLIGRDDA